MQPRHYRNLIVRALANPQDGTLDRLVTQLSEASRAMEILRAKGYGTNGMSLSATAALVPNSK